MDIHLNLSTEPVTRAHPAPPTCVEASTSIRDCLAVLKSVKRGCALVCRDGVLVGIFTERDALRLMPRRPDWDAPIETVMTRDPVALKPDDTVGAAIRKMSAGHYRHLPIVDAAGRPTGMLKSSSIMHYLVEHFPKTVYTQPPMARLTMQQREGA